MRKIIWAICAVILVGAIALLIWMPGMGTTAPSPSEPPVASESMSDPKPADTGYTVKEYNGGIAVFSDRDDKPFRVTDVDIRSLPQKDQEELKAGIHVTNLEEVNRLMEDYCS